MITSRSGTIRNSTVDIIYDSEKEFQDDLRTFKDYESSLRKEHPYRSEAKDLSSLIRMLESGFNPHDESYRGKPTTRIPDSSAQIIFHVLRAAVRDLTS